MLQAEKRARTKLQAKMDHREALLERYRRDNGRLMRVLVTAGTCAAWCGAVRFNVVRCGVVWCGEQK